MPSRGKSKCKVPETRMNVTRSRDGDKGDVAERRKGLGVVGCEGQEEDREGPRGSPGLW